MTATLKSRLIVTGAMLVAGTIAFPLASLRAVANDDVHMIEVEGEGAKYWSRWRGPSGQGLVPDGGNYVDRWSPTRNVKWKTPVPGAGNSSPIIWGDHIFLTTAYDGGKRLSMLAFRRSNGERLWETSIPIDAVEHVHQKNGHASATPATDGELVYASFGRHGLVAVDFSGKVVWHQKFSEIANYHGPAGSPVLYKDRIFLYQDQKPVPDQTAFVAAFDRKTGRQIWRTPRTETVGWGTPVVIRAGDRDELVVSSQRRVAAYDPDTGRELWSVGGLTFEVIPTPVVGEGLVFCSSGRAGPTLAIRPGGRGDVTETHVAWDTPKGSPFVPSGVIYDGLLYLVNDMQSIATVYEAKSGELMYQGRMGVAQREGFSASPVAVNGKIYFTNDEGETFVLQAGREFNLLHTNSLGARTLASPALVDGVWYWRTVEGLVAIGN
jgi:outer membrane protein assembly factor BamB